MEREDKKVELAMVHSAVGVPPGAKEDSLIVHTSI
jgi:hypothetical protein